MPSNGSPENYILDRPRDPALSATLGELWELDPSGVVGVGKSERTGPWPAKSRVRVSLPESLPPIFRVGGLQLLFIRQDVEEVLRAVAGDSFVAEPAEPQ